MKYKPPKSAQETAKKVLRWKKKYPEEVKAMTPIGWARTRQLASGKSVSEDVVKRMARFKRHQKNAKIDSKHKGKPWKDRGYVAWEGWGGTEGVNWAIRKSKQIKTKNI